MILIVVFIRCWFQGGEQEPDCARVFSRGREIAKQLLRCPMHPCRPHLTRTAPFQADSMESTTDPEAEHEKDAGVDAVLAAASACMMAVGEIVFPCVQRTRRPPMVTRPPPPLSLPPSPHPQRRPSLK